MAIEDVTKLVERLEAFEDRLGVRLESLHAQFLEFDDGEREVVLRGELHPKSGTELQQNVELVVAAYDSSSRLVGTDHAYFVTSKFFGFEAFQVRVTVYVTKVTRLRVYPKLM